MLPHVTVVSTHTFLVCGARSAAIAPGFGYSQMTTKLFPWWMTVPQVASSPARRDSSGRMQSVEEEASEALLSDPGGNTTNTGRLESKTKGPSCWETFAAFENGVGSVK